MAFVNEVPTRHDIETYGLPFQADLGLALDIRRIWTVDRERKCHLWNLGLSGPSASGSNVHTIAHFYMDGIRVQAHMHSGTHSVDFDDDPFYIRWETLFSIEATPRHGKTAIALPHTAWDYPDEPQGLLDNLSLDEFRALLKEALWVHKKGNSNRLITGTVVVEFEF